MADFITSFEKKVIDTIRKYSLFNKSEKILVAASGGKDSTTLLYILKKYDYNIEAITIDVSVGKYSETNLNNLKAFCGSQKIKLHEYSLRQEFGYSLCYLRSFLKAKGVDLNSCAICGTLRRNVLNKKSRELGAKKLVTGHNLDDESQSIIMNLLRNDFNRLVRLGPKTGIISDDKIIPRVKPLYFIEENEIIKYSKKMKFPVNYLSCPCSIGVHRRYMCKILDAMEKKHKKIKYNIISSFLSLQPKIIREAQPGKINHCEKCGEPTNKNICRVCELTGARTE